MKFLFFSLCFCIILTFNVNLIAATNIEQVDDSDLIHLLTGEENVVALFTKSNCKACDDLEIIVENIQQDLKDNLNAVVVKAHNTQIISIYDPQKEPSLIFFRKGIPLLYYGDINEEAILQMFTENKDPVVKELSDENFEHLTQAATGATTGDWFVFFYSADCVMCQRLYAIWEAVGANLRRTVNVARVNRLGAGTQTAKRFGITASPEFIFLRHGKVYRYKVKEYTPKSFIEFAESGHRKQTRPEAVPALPGAFDELIESYLMHFLSSRGYVIIVIALMVLLIYVSFKFSKKPKPAAKPSSNKKSK